MKNTNNLVGKHERINDILYNVYGMTSSIMDNSIVVCCDGRDIGAIEGNYNCDAICSDFGYLYFESTVSISHWDSSESLLMTAFIDDDGTRKIKIKDRDFGEVSFKISDGHMCVSRIEYDKVRGLVNRREAVSILFNPSGNVLVGHLETDCITKESFTSLKSYDSSLKTDINVNYKLVEFAKCCVSKLREVMPNGFDSFFELGDPIVYGFFKNNLLGEGINKETDSVKTTDGVVYSKANDLNKK